MAQHPASSPQQPQLDSRLFWRWVASSLRPILGWVFAVAGAIVLIVAWWRISSEVLVARQLPILASGGFGGLALVFFGAKLLSSQDLRRHEDRLQRLETLVDDLHELLLAEATPGAPVAEPPLDLEPATSPVEAATNGARTVVVLPSGHSFHHPDCGLVTDKQGVERISARDAEERGMTACRRCSPATHDAGAVA